MATMRHRQQGSSTKICRNIYLFWRSSNRKFDTAPLQPRGCIASRHAAWKWPVSQNQEARKTIELLDPWEPGPALGKACFQEFEYTWKMWLTYSSPHNPANRCCRRLILVCHVVFRALQIWSTLVQLAKHLLVCED